MGPINTPEELLEFMSNNIKYGYLGKTGRVYRKTDKDFYDKWEKEYILQNKDDLLETLHGDCFDQVEFERDWFTSNNYEVRTFFEMVRLNYKNIYPVHSFLIYQDSDKWYWFENSDSNNRGIHEFDSLEELLDYQFNKYLELLKTFNITDEEIKKIVVVEFTKPNSHISLDEYFDHVFKDE